MPGRIGHYELQERLGLGGMGEVFRAVDTKMFGRAVALKITLPELGQNPEILARFRREVRIAATLRHPNIVTIFDFGSFEGREYYVMEYIAGHELTEIIRDRGARTLAQRVEIAMQIADALDSAHTHDPPVIHRDIKPANVLVIGRRGRDQVKLLDFGIAHVDSPDSSHTSTQPGTVLYMSPEQLRSEREIDHRTDLFSFGILCYEMFTGVHPFQGSSHWVICTNILKEDPKRPRDVDPSIPVELEALILDLLAKHASDRPSSAAEVVDRLRTLLPGGTLATFSDPRGAEGLVPTTDPTPTPLDAERQQLVSAEMLAVEELLDAGAVAEARARLASVLRRYPDEDRAHKLLDALITATGRGIPFQKFRSALKRGREALESARLAEAARAAEEAVALWPDNEDATALAERVAKRRGEEIADLLARATALVEAAEASPSRPETIGTVADARSLLARAADAGAESESIEPLLERARACESRAQERLEAERRRDEERARRLVMLRASAEAARRLAHEQDRTSRAGLQTRLGHLRDAREALRSLLVEDPDDRVSKLAVTALDDDIAAAEEAVATLEAAQREREMRRAAIVDEARSRLRATPGPSAATPEAADAALSELRAVERDLRGVVAEDPEQSGGAEALDDLARAIADTQGRLEQLREARRREARIGDVAGRVVAAEQSPDGDAVATAKGLVAAAEARSVAERLVAEVDDAAARALLDRARAREAALAARARELERDASRARLRAASEGAFASASSARGNDLSGVERAAGLWSEAKRAAEALVEASPDDAAARERVAACSEALDGLRRREAELKRREKAAALAAALRQDLAGIAARPRSKAKLVERSKADAAALGERLLGLREVDAEAADEIARAVENLRAELGAALARPTPAREAAAEASVAPGPRPPRPLRWLGVAGFAVLAVGAWGVYEMVAPSPRSPAAPREEPRTAVDSGGTRDVLDASRRGLASIAGEADRDLVAAVASARARMGELETLRSKDPAARAEIDEVARLWGSAVEAGERRDRAIGDALRACRSAIERAERAAAGSEGDKRAALAAIDAAERALDAAQLDERRRDEGRDVLTRLGAWRARLGPSEKGPTFAPDAEVGIALQAADVELRRSATTAEDLRDVAAGLRRRAAALRALAPSPALRATVSAKVVALDNRAVAIDRQITDTLAASDRQQRVVAARRTAEDLLRTAEGRRPTDIKDADAFLAGPVARAESAVRDYGSLVAPQDADSAAFSRRLEALRKSASALVVTPSSDDVTAIRAVLEEWKAANEAKDAAAVARLQIRADVKNLESTFRSLASRKIVLRDVSISVAPGGDAADVRCDCEARNLGNLAGEREKVVRIAGMKMTRVPAGWRIANVQFQGSR